ncbi:MAG: VOC family protein [Spirochaetales bacterium]|nr:VOC family protein [Spirochaetales bacterium]
MKVYYVVLYVKDPEASLKFWTEKVGMVSKSIMETGRFKIHKVGFPDQDFSFELVPLDLMKNNPDNLNLGTPSICFSTPDLVGLNEKLTKSGVKVSSISNHFGQDNFAFSDNSDNWFAVVQDIA